MGHTTVYIKVNLITLTFIIAWTETAKFFLISRNYLNAEDPLLHATIHIKIKIYVYEEISKISHLNWRQKVQKFFWRAHLPHTIFSIRIDPQNNVQLVNTKK